MKKVVFIISILIGLFVFFNNNAIAQTCVGSDTICGSETVLVCTNASGDTCNFGDFGCVCNRDCGGFDIISSCSGSYSLVLSCDPIAACAALGGVCSKSTGVCSENTPPDPTCNSGSSCFTGISSSSECETYGYSAGSGTCTGGACCAPAVPCASGSCVGDAGVCAAGGGTLTGGACTGGVCCDYPVSVECTTGTCIAGYATCGDAGMNNGGGSCTGGICCVPKPIETDLPPDCVDVQITSVSKLVHNPTSPEQASADIKVRFEPAYLRVRTCLRQKVEPPRHFWFGSNTVLKPSQKCENVDLTAGPLPPPAGIQEETFTILFTPFEDLSFTGAQQVPLEATAHVEYTSATGVKGDDCTPTTRSVWLANISGPWWQAVNGDAISVNGNIESGVPADYSLMDTTGDYDPGVVVYAGTTLDTGNGDISSTNMYVNGNLDMDLYNYTYFESKVPSGTLYNLSDPSLTPAGLASALSSATSDSNGYKWLVFSGDLNLVGEFNISEKVVLYVDGDVNIGNNILLDDNANDFFMLIARGGVTIDANAGNGPDPAIEGIFYTENSFETTSGNTRIVFQGSFVADGFVFGRSIGINNSTIPAEQFIFDPEILLNYPRSLAPTRVVWKEVAP